MDDDTLCQVVRQARDRLVAEAENEAFDPSPQSLLAVASKDPACIGIKLTANHIKKAMRMVKKQMDQEKEDQRVAAATAPAAEPTRAATMRAIEANGGVPPATPFDTCAVECRVLGQGLTLAAVKHPAEFIIESYDSTGKRRATGGDAFFVAIRGASRVRARITDNGDGSYKVEWKPPQAGAYSIAVSFFGVALPGSPFMMTVSTPAPFAANCVAKGAALYKAVARATQSFQVAFKDRLGNMAQAVDLDVYVEPVPVAAPRQPALDALSESDGSSLLPSALGGNSKGSFKSRVAAVRELTASSNDGGEVAEDGYNGAAAPAVTEPVYRDESFDFEDPSEREGVVTRQRTLRVKVGQAPLVIRAAEALDSPQIGVLNPGQMATVLMEKISTGKVRARARSSIPRRGPTHPFPCHEPHFPFPTLTGLRTVI